MYRTTAFVTLLLSAAVNAVPCAPTEYEYPVVEFQPWTTECGNTAYGHTLGLYRAYREYQDLCFPLPDDVHGLDVLHLADGCELIAFKSPVCNDYPQTGFKKTDTGCLAFRSHEFRSYKVKCAQ
ncbi:hypothetical protein VTJ49DRAFT_1713 [Mycothermus thermophilus]|uniref:Uncharacterized protein n=1 Tax=Humicola insolens TaxID=85995 RepID=A0ABR3VBK2_HUMIN